MGTILISALISGVVSMIVSTYIDSQKRLKEAKFLIYQELINNLSEMFLSYNDQTNDDKSKKTLRQFPVISIIGSVKVVNNLYKLRVAITESANASNNNHCLEAFDELFNSIREDLGHEMVKAKGLLISCLNQTKLMI